MSIINEKACQKIFQGSKEADREKVHGIDDPAMALGP